MTIDTTYLDADSDNPRFARPALLQTTQFCNDLSSPAAGKGADLSGLENGAAHGGRTIGAALSGTVWLNAWSGVDPTGVSDSAAAINVALATGRDVVGFGIFKTTSVLAFSSTQGQRLTIRGELRPTFRGDTIRILAFEQMADVAINGADQPGTGAAGAAFVIGFGGSNAQQSSVARSRVINYTGHAVLWENGAMVDFTGFHAQSITGDGIRCTGTYDDNNHGHFVDTHIIGASGVGYNILPADSNVFYNANASRSHQFLNAKAFGCGKNFFIGSTGNVGTVFSELGTNPDEFGTLSAGNDISVIETQTAFAAWIDNTANGINNLRGYNSYNNFAARNEVFAQLTNQDRYEGRRVLKHTGNRAFRDYIEATTGAVTVTHDAGTASSRKDKFAGQLELPGSAGALNITYSRTGVLTPTVGALAAGATTYYTVAAATTGAGSGMLAFATLGMGATSGLIQTTCNIEQTGDLTIILQNVGASSVTLGAVSLRWAILSMT